jgi:hypothetical protein
MTSGSIESSPPTGRATPYLDQPSVE